MQEKKVLSIPYPKGVAWDSHLPFTLNSSSNNTKPPVAPPFTSPIKLANNSPDPKQCEVCGKVWLIKNWEYKIRSIWKQLKIKVFEHYQTGFFGDFFSVNHFVQLGSSAFRCIDKVKCWGQYRGKDQEAAWFGRIIVAAAASIPSRDRGKQE